MLLTIRNEIMVLAKPAIGTSVHHLEAKYIQTLLTLTSDSSIIAAVTTICKFMTEEIRVQMSWVVSFAEHTHESEPPNFIQYKFLQAIDYTLNIDMIGTDVIQDSTLASIRSVSQNCMIIENPHYIMENHYSS